jgi:hypothetical protein
MYIYVWKWSACCYILPTFRLLKSQLAVLLIQARRIRSEFELRVVRDTLQDTTDAHEDRCRLRHIRSITRGGSLFFSCLSPPFSCIASVVQTSCTTEENAACMRNWTERRFLYGFGNDQQIFYIFLKSWIRVKGRKNEERMVISNVDVKLLRLIWW